MNIFIDFLPIKTERLTIVKTTSEDINLLLKIDKQEETQKYLGGIKNKPKEERLEFLKNKISSLTVYLDKTPIGFVELKQKENNPYELSYIFDYDYWNKGYCTEVCNKLIDIAFNELNIDCVYATTLKENIKSIKVLERLGFIYINNIEKDNIMFLNYIISNK